MLSLYLNLINNTYNNIMNCLTKLNDDQFLLYREKVLNIMKKEINYNQDYKNILNELRELWGSLNRLLFEIEDIIDKLNYINEHIIKNP